MRIRKREIAKAGVYGTADNPQVVSTKDIKEIAETFTDVRRAPIQFGHEANAADPRLGNVVSVYSDNDGSTLYADIEEHDTLADAVDSGYYPDVSIGARQRAKDGKMYLRHLAYLGQEAPAIKNLIAEIKEPLNIAAADADNIVILPSPRELMLSEQTNQKKEDSNVTKEEAQRLREENEQLKIDLQKKELSLSDSIKQKKDADIERFKSALESRKIPRGIWEKALLLCEALEDGKTITLSDAAAPGGKRSATPAGLFIEILSAFPRPVQPGVLNLDDHDEQGHTKRDLSRLRNKG